MKKLNSILLSMSFTGLLLFACSGGGGGGGTGGTGGTGDPGGTGGPSTPAPAPITEFKGTPVAWNGYKVIMPEGMTLAENGSNNYVAMDYGQCRISLWPLETAEVDQHAQALSVLRRLTGADIAGKYSSSPLDEHYHIQGISGEGWSYVELQGYIKDVNGNKTGEHVRILLAKLGDKSAVMVGDDRGYGCLDESYTSFGLWLPVFYTLSFPDYHAPDPEALRKALIGGWFGTVTSTITTYWSDTFAANSRYLHTQGYNLQYDAYPGDGLVYETNSQWAGDGYWSVSGNKLTTWPSSEQPKTEYMRVFKQYKSGSGASTVWDTYFMRVGIKENIFVEQYAVKEK